MRGKCGELISTISSEASAAHCSLRGCYLVVGLGHVDVSLMEVRSAEGVVAKMSLLFCNRLCLALALLAVLVPPAHSNNTRLSLRSHRRLNVFHRVSFCDLILISSRALCSRSSRKMFTHLRQHPSTSGPTWVATTKLIAHRDLQHEGLSLDSSKREPV